MAAIAAFKRCTGCGAKVPSTDGHDRCLFCLGESHPVHSCTACRQFSKAAQKNRKNRLQAHLMASALQPRASPSTPPRPSASTSSDLPPPPPTPEMPKKKKKKEDKREGKKGTHRHSSLPPPTPRSGRPSPSPPRSVLSAPALPGPSRPASPASARDRSHQTSPEASPPAPPPRGVSLLQDRRQRAAQGETVPVQALQPLLRAMMEEMSRFFPRASDPSPSDPSGRIREDTRPAKRPRTERAQLPELPSPPLPPAGDEPSSARPHWSDSDPEASLPPPSDHGGSDGSDIESVYGDPDDPDLEQPADPDRSPEDQIGSKDRTQPEDQRTLTGLLTRLGSTLNLRVETPPAPFTDEVCGLAETKKILPVHLPLLPAVYHDAKAVWRKPFSGHNVSTRLDGVYKVLGEEAEFLHTHPAPNSRIVRASQHRTATSSTPVPASKEGKKMEALGRRIYSHGSFAFRATNYAAAMGAYQVKLWSKMEALGSKLSPAEKAEFESLCKEGTQLGQQQIRTSRHVCESEAKNIAAAVQIRRHAWLRSADFQEETKRLVEEMPFDGKGLFAAETDSALKELQEDMTTTSRLRLSSSQTARRRTYQSTASRPDYSQRPATRPSDPARPHRPKRQYAQQRFAPQQPQTSAKRYDRKQKQV